MERRCEDGRAPLQGFHLATRPTNLYRVFPPPEVPRDFDPVHKFSADDAEKCRFHVAIVYGNLRDKVYVEMLEEHRAKKRRTEEEPVKEEEKTPVKEEKPKETPPPLRRHETVCA